MHHAAYPLVQYAHTIKTWSRPIHRRLTVPAQPHIKWDQNIADMSINLHAMNPVVDIPVCTSIEDIKAAIIEDTELQMVQAHIIRGWPNNKDELEPSLDRYWPIYA